MAHTENVVTWICVWYKERLLSAEDASYGIPALSLPHGHGLLPGGRDKKKKTLKKSDRTSSLGPTVWHMDGIP